MSDSVNHPSHYNQGEVETIDGIRAALGEGFADYCRGNVLKYVWRCGKKGDALEDLRKAAKYLEWAIEALESDDSENQCSSHVEGVWVEEAGKIEPTDSLPDPGPGYRLLSKDPPEGVIKGDEFYFFGEWVESGNCEEDGSGKQSPAYYYRRKIEPTEWVPGVGDKVRVIKPGRVATGRIGEITEEISGLYTVQALNVSSRDLEAKDLELIEAAQ